MSGKLKQYVGNRVFETLRRNRATTPEKLKSAIRIGNAQGAQFPTLSIPLDLLQKELGIPNTNDILNLRPDNIITKVYIGNDRANRKITFDIDRNVFVKDVLENIIVPDKSGEKRKILIEFSSPNIAKPFHVGHLRSTMIGNFISNLNKYLGHDVVRMNYLGDWGTQFGLLKVGVDLSNLSEDKIKANPLQTLYQAYVHANKLAQSDPKINEQARKIFEKLEHGELNDVETWKTYNQYTIDELNNLYKRLNVTFDIYNYESMYNARDIQNVIRKLEKRKILETSPDGKRYTMVKDRKVSLVKSDGTMLYLTRDIAAALDRYEKYKFDQMLYVVDNGQSDHFNALHDVLFRLDLPWAGRIKHVKFGRIRGMSTRKGTAVFLSDILNEAKELMRQNQIQSPTTKAAITDERTTDILGISCVIINDLKQRRQKDYEFDWKRVLQAQGDTGIRLQYTHCRLKSLQRVNDIPTATECNPMVLQQPDIMQLVTHLARFTEVIYQCHQQMEACLLVVYLFHLCNHVNKVLQVLRVKDEEIQIAEQRLLLFNASREVLRQGIEILGLEPLDEM